MCSLAAFLGQVTLRESDGGIEVGVCRLCGSNAGFLRHVHKECESRHALALENLVSLAASSVLDGSQLDGLREKAKTLARGNFVSGTEIQDALISGWESAVERMLTDGILDENEEQKLVKFQNTLEFSQERLNIHGTLTRVTKAAILRDIMNGIAPNRMKIEGGAPFNLQKNEALIWVFPDTSYFEERTRRVYHGGSRGMSIRIAKGVYYRFGAFKGHAVESKETVHVDTGILGVTNKHLYFAGPSKSFRIRTDKIVSINPFEDGVGIFKDSASAKPQLFKTGDGWFTYNLLQNINNLS